MVGRATTALSKWSTNWSTVGGPNSAALHHCFFYLVPAGLFAPFRLSGSHSCEIAPREWPFCEPFEGLADPQLVPTRRHRARPVTDYWMEQQVPICAERPVGGPSPI
jgi:hypothetical protein